MTEPSPTNEDRQAAYDAQAPEAPPRTPEEHRVHSRRSMLVGGAAIAVGALGFRWVQKQPLDNRIPGPLRSSHERNEALWSRLFREDHLAPTFDASESSVLRVNGRKGLESDIDLDSWELLVRNHQGTEIDRLGLDDIKALPMHEMTIEHKCVEGWSQVTTWGGARFSDFAAAYEPNLSRSYVGLVTPDRGYYAGLDMATMLHPQTLLVYEMMGQALDLAHGAPLRLATPLKYGIKQLKRIGSIQFTDDKPDDYWFERGYDYYSGL